MISKRMRKMLVENPSQLVQPIKEVAVIYEDHRLDHALLLMTHNRFSVVPVIDASSKLKGLISLPLIIESITGLEDIHFDKLAEYSVKEVMDTDFPVVSEAFDLEEVLQTLVHHAFIPVVGSDNELVGIITRSEILKGANRIVHEYDKKYIEPILKLLSE